MFGNSSIGFLLLITHILSCLTVGFLFRFWKRKNIYSSNLSKKYYYSNNVSLSNLGEIIGNSISNATSTIMMIGGYVVIFSVIISIFKSSHLLSISSFFLIPILNFFKIPSTFNSSIITGIIEITNGIALISDIPIKHISINIILSAFLLGFGGISVFLQVFSIVSKTDLSIKPYIVGKILHGLFAAFYTFLFMQIFPMFNFNL